MPTSLNNKLEQIQFLAGVGEMGVLTRAYDWAGSTLGSPGQWPQSLRTAVRLMLSSHHPVFIWWGPDLIQFYNDAYRETMGPERHPSALGDKGRDCWAEIWPIIGPQISRNTTFVARAAKTPTKAPGSRRDLQIDGLGNL